MWTRSLKCSPVVLFACAFLAGSGTVLVQNGVGASALSSDSALEHAENIPDAHDRHKGIRSYDSTGFPHDNDANRDVKSYGTPSGHGASHDHGIKDGGHGYNKNGDACSKCKWENDDWEQDEPEEEGDENDGAECDDGQYRPEHHGPGGGHKSRPHPSGVYKTGPTGGSYGDGAGSLDSPLGGVNYPSGPGHTRPINDYVTTPKSVAGWSTPFADASKPGHGGVNTATFGTTPSSWPGWNKGTAPGGTGPPKPTWSGGRFPSSQKPGSSVPNFDATSKPGQEWNQYPSGPSSAVPHTGSGVLPPNNYGNPQENQNRPYGQPVPHLESNLSPPNYGNPQESQKRPYGQPAPHTGSGISPPGSYGNPQENQNRPYGQPSPHSGSGVSPSSYGNPQESQNKPYGQPAPHSGSNVSPPSYGNPQDSQNRPYGQPVPHAGSSAFPPGSYGSPQDNKNRPYGQSVPHPGSGASPPSYGNPQGNQNRPYGQPVPQSTYAGAFAGASVTSGIGSPSGVPSFGRKEPVSSQSPNRPYSGTNQAPNTDSDYYGQGGYNKPEPGSQSTSPATNTFGTTKGPYGGIGSPTSVPGTQSYPSAPYDGSSRPNAGFPNTGFGTTKTPFSHISTPGSTLTTPYDRTGPKQPNFNFASSSATANAGASAFAGTYSNPSITGTPSLYGTTPTHTGGSNYTPGVKGSVGNRPVYGNAPHGTHPNIGSGTWPSGQPGSNTGPWSSGRPGSGISPNRPSPGTSGILPGKQPQGGSGTWPGQGQPGHPGSGPGCPGGNCGGATPQAGSNCEGCCGNYNCDSLCNGGGNVPATHGLCSGTGPSGVNKTYYPVGTGDGNVPTVGTIYGPDSRPNIGAGAGAPGNQLWNPGNPFLFGSSTPNSVSHHPWTPTTEKPIGEGNVFLDSNWNKPKPGYTSADNDKNVIPHGGNNKPIGQGNVFLDGNRGNNANPNEGVIPLEEKMPGKNNPFLKPLTNSGGPSYPDRSGTPGNYPGSGTPGSYPGQGTPGSYPGQGTPGSYPGLETPGGSPGQGTPGNYPGQGTPGSYPGSGTPGSYPGQGTPGSYPGSGTPGSYPGQGTPGSYPGSGTPGNYPGSGTPGNYPESPGSPGGGSYGGSSPQGTGTLECKLGLFGCGTPGSGSYVNNKYPGGAVGGNAGAVTGNLGGNVPGGSGNLNPVPGQFTAGGNPGSGGNNFAASVSGAQARAYSGAFSSAQASSSSSASSFSGASGLANNLGGNMYPNGAQNQGGSNSWASSGASAFASSSAGSWAGNSPTNVKG
ncbi:collagen alpha-1(III) chain isoform X2 [Solenopsis invicta]|uniref:collagen alpha-1(III) chain isoform X2 n=1 Tax=Solenopsis invicta TaxID=13686 RepID=UPI00193CF420|nr:collagen alpha-1(III) chain isoform X2 [Solenopsis invicta]